MSGSGRPFARIERLAASLLGARHAFVHLADGERERLLAAGQRAEESPDAALLGGRPLLPARPLVVGDASRHPRLHSHQAVAGEAAIRFIAAAPLLTEEGELLGVLHVMDPRPRGPLSTSECENLAALAELACDELVLRGAAPAVPATPALAARLTSRELEETRRRARDDERLRLARELHDGLGKDLFGLALLLESVADRQKGRAVSHELREYAAT
ncbi:MAG TPA: GAF domain-containing protein, partial [Deinococcales bacterium]|nr:GAF domain-containing protein [Deinococcales bacterium]